MRIAMVALVVGLTAAPLLAADPPAKKTKPVGAWVRETGDWKLTFDIKADDTLTVKLSNGTVSFQIQADYGVTKDGTLFGYLTGIKKVGEDNGPSEGDMFSFRFKIDKDTLTLSDLGGTHVNAEAKNLVEGEYKKSK
jgi:hypothetical protein